MEDTFKSQVEREMSANKAHGCAPIMSKLPPPVRPRQSFLRRDGFLTLQTFGGDKTLTFCVLVFNSPSFRFPLLVLLLLQVLLRISSPIILALLSVSIYSFPLLYPSFNHLSILFHRLLQILLVPSTSPPSSSLPLWVKIQNSTWTYGRLNRITPVVIFNTFRRFGKD